MTTDTQKLESEKKFLSEYQQILENHSKIKKAIFQYVRERLYSIFDELVGYPKESSTIKNICEYATIQIEQLLNSYQYCLDETEIADKITPRILADIFEISIGKLSKQKEGTYYTSRLDVMFMCKEAIAQFLLNRTNKNDIVLDIIWQEKLDPTIFTSNEISEITNLLQEITILDPACGCGEFIVAMTSLLSSIWIKILDRTGEMKSEFQIASTILSSNLFGIDINNEALNICKKRLDYLANRNRSNNDLKQSIECQIDCKDLLTDTIEFQEFFKTVSERFDIIIGNPPYLRQETFGSIVNNHHQIEKNQRTYKEKVLGEIAKLSEGKESQHRYLKSDFYIYFFYKALNILKDDGVVCFITSNSWLDAKFGFKFQEYLLNNFILNKIYTNLHQKSFSAAVNTIVTVLSNSNREEHKLLQAKFIAIKQLNYKSLEMKHLLEIQKATSNITTSAYQLKTITQSDLYSSGSNITSYIGLKWGAFFFRAPQNYHQILEKINSKLVPLKAIGKVRYPIKTGINQFFFVDKDTIQKYQLEIDFLLPVLKSPKKIVNYQISVLDVQYYLFNCQLSKEELLQQKKEGALSYIQWGEEQTTEKKQQSIDGVSWPEVPTVRRNKPYWYTTPLLPQADIFCTRFFDKRYFFCYSNFPIVEDQTFYGLVLNEQYQAARDLIIALTNSTLSYYFLEIFGRTSLGKGALQYSIDDMNNHRIINPKMIPLNIQKELVSKFQLLKERNLKSIFEEVKMKDRIDFDKVIFDWLGFSELDTKALYNSFLQLTKSRLEKSGQKIELL